MKFHVIIMPSSLDFASKRAVMPTAISCENRMHCGRQKRARRGQPDVHITRGRQHKQPVISATMGSACESGPQRRLTQTRTRCRPKAACSKETRLSTPVGTRRNWAKRGRISSIATKTIRLAEEAFQVRSSPAPVWCALVDSRRARARRLCTSWAARLPAESPSSCISIRRAAICC